MMPANQLWRKRNSLKIVKIDRNAEHEPTHLQFKTPSFLFKRRGEKLSLSFLCLPHHLIKCQEGKVLMGNFLTAAALGSDGT